MKRKHLFFLLILSLFLSISSVWSQTNLYVATNGNDNNSGTINSPLKTLIGARNKVRNLKSSGLPNGGIVVNFRGGTYPVTSTCNLDAQDAGAPNKPIVYRGYQKELVIFDGALDVGGSGFARTTSSHAGKLHGNAVGNVYYKQITNANAINVLKGEGAQISMNGKMMNIARFPNMGFAHINETSLTAGYETLKTDGTFSQPKGARFQLYEGMNNADRFANEVRRTERVKAHGYISALWHKESILVASGTNGWLRLKDGTSYGVQRLVDKNRPIRMYVHNVLCELDQAGEWYFDVSDNTLYVWPYETIENSSQFGVWAGPELVNVINSEYIEFKHLTIQHFAKRTNGDGVLDFRSGNNFLVAGVTFKYTTMASCNFWGNVTNSTMQSCNFFDCGGTRLYGGSYTSTGTIKKGNNKIENCHFTNIHSKDFYGKATGINGVSNVFRNNMIHNTNGQPLTFAGIDHYIANNETFNVGVEEGDGGAFYTGNDLVSYGNVLRHNFFHHIMSLPGVNIGRASIHVDDMDSGDKIEENIFFKGGWKAIKFGRGAGHTVQKNILLDCYEGIATGVGGAEKFDPCMDYLNSEGGKSPTDNIKANYIGRMLQKVGVSGWENSVNSGNWNTKIEQFWRDRYPYFDYVMNSYFNDQTMDAYQCRFYDNMFFSSDNMDINKGGSIAAVRGSQAVNYSMFNNWNTLQFSWKSPKPNFAPNIPFDNIGLYEDEYRCHVPTKTTFRKNVKDHFENVPSFGGTYNRNTVNGIVYYNSGKMITDLTNSCYTDGGNSGGEENEGWFDLGTATSPVFDGYIRVTENTTSGNYRWTNGNNLDSRDRGTGANNLNRDFVFSDQARTFEYTTANGTYDVVVTLGDLNGPHDDMIIKAEGTTVKSNIDRTTGQIANETFQVTVSDGKLSLEFSDGGGSNQHWVVNRIKIDPATSTCNPTAITPYIQVDGGAWQQTANVSVSSGASVVFGPHPVSGGTWSWSGCGTSGSSRGQTITPTSTCTSTAIYTNDCGAQTQQQFVITVSGGGTPNGQSPYGGSNRAIPGTIEAEDFDNGGEGAAYHDVDATNKGNNVARENEGVDIEARDGGTTIGWIANGEWLEYTVNATAGTYKIEARVASNASGKKMLVKLGGTTLGTITAPNTGSWGTFQTVSIDNITVSGGNNKVLRLEFDGGSINLNWVKFTSSGGTPPSGNPIVVEAENLADEGGTYNDGHVPVGVGVNAGVGINWLNNGDWAEYNVNIPADGEYEIVYNIASPNNNTTIQLSVDGTSVNTTTVPNTGGWETYNSLTASETVNLTAGMRVIRLTAGPSTWTWNLDKFTLTRLGDMKSAKTTSTPLSVNVYPNPAKEILNISINSSIEDNASITIYSSVGTKLKMETIADVHHQVSISELESGMYILQITNGNDIISKSFIKK